MSDDLAAKPVDRCVCANITFATMKSYIDEHGGDLAVLRAQFNCGAGCTLCVRYVEAMLRTGRVRFAVEDEALCRVAPDHDRPL